MRQHNFVIFSYLTSQMKYEERKRNFDSSWPWQLQGVHSRWKFYL